MAENSRQPALLLRGPQNLYARSAAHASPMHMTAKHDIASMHAHACNEASCREARRLGRLRVQQYRSSGSEESRER